MEEVICVVGGSFDTVKDTLCVDLSAFQSLGPINSLFKLEAVLMMRILLGFYVSLWLPF